MSRQYVLMKRQSMQPQFRSVRVDREQGHSIELHAHEESQLIYAASGTMQVHTASGRWLVPPSLGVWVPTLVPHCIDVLTDAQLWLVYWSPAATAAWAPVGLTERSFALKVTPLLRELLRMATLVTSTDMRMELTVRLILQELTEASDAPTFLPLPVSAIGRRVADLLLADPCDQRGLEEMASAAATSPRTISRLFPAETGLTFKLWRQRARIVSSIERLAAGMAIHQVAYEMGFASAAAFTVAFRQVTMMTPTDFQRSALNI
jgi:AraC-like DNA-binding protein/quercetin dioxygenase-like cupin family protein